ncbi:nuclease HARBI1 [Labeo rohita]|uniref:Nuclease HARBI1 n=1 Tax=Labeo rohita TaxID=84645 RepID=A0A498MGB0_LABRO|nr:nuclease HARBI1 [Labeo rohita]
MLLYRPNKVCRIVLACGVHNVTHRHGIPLGEVVPPPNDPDPGPVTACVKTLPDGRASALGGTLETLETPDTMGSGWSGGVDSECVSLDVPAVAPSESK